MQSLAKMRKEEKEEEEKEEQEEEAIGRSPAVSETLRHFTAVSSRLDGAPRRFPNCPKSVISSTLSMAHSLRLGGGSWMLISPLCWRIAGWASATKSASSSMLRGGRTNRRKSGGAWENWSVVGSMSGSWSAGYGSSASLTTDGGTNNGAENRNNNGTSASGEGVADTMASFARSLSQAVGHSVDSTSSSVSRAVKNKKGTEDPLDNAFGKRGGGIGGKGNKNCPVHRRGMSLGALPLHGVSDLRVTSANDTMAKATAVSLETMAPAAVISAVDTSETRTIPEEDSESAQISWTPEKGRESPGREW